MLFRSFSVVDNPNSTIKTVRERINVHQKNPACAGCHKIMDPMGLALENFDSIGRFRAAEKGATIDASGVLDGRTFKDPNELGQVLHDHPALTSCVVRRVYAYGSGAPIRADDKDVLEYFNTRFSEAGYRFPDLMRIVALSNSFSEVIEPKPAAPAVKTADASVTK